MSAGLIGSEHVGTTYEQCQTCGERATHWTTNFVFRTKTNLPCGCTFWFRPADPNARRSDPPPLMVFIGRYDSIPSEYGPTDHWLRAALSEATLSDAIPPAESDTLVPNSDD